MRVFSYGFPRLAIRRPAPSASRPRLRTLARDERGVTALEFGLVGPLFFALMFGIISVGFYFFTTFTLENGVEDAARLIRTGQMQTVTVAPGPPAVYTYPASFAGVCTTATDLPSCFKAQVCSHLPTYVDCTSKVSIIVTAFPTGFAAVTIPSCLSGGSLATGSYTPGTSNQVVLVTACYQWDFAGQIPFLKLGTMTNGAAMISASAVFMTEPYQ